MRRGRWQRQRSPEEEFLAAKTGNRVEERRAAMGRLQQERGFCKVAGALSMALNHKHEGSCQDLGRLVIEA